MTIGSSGLMDQENERVLRSKEIATTDEENAEVSSLFETDTIYVDTKRLAIISDIHSNYTAYQAVLEDLEEREYDHVLHLGDYVGYYTMPNEVLDVARKQVDFAVMGNHDFAAIEPRELMYSTLHKDAKKALDHNKSILTPQNKKYLRSLPMKIELQTDFGDATLVHGDPMTIFGYIYGSTEQKMNREIRQALSSVTTKYLFVGHTHIQGKLYTNGQIYINPGAVGQPRDNDPRVAYAILDLEKEEVDLHRVSYDLEQVKQNIHACNFPSSFALRLERGV